MDKKKTLLFDVDCVIIPDRWFVAINEFMAEKGRPTYNSLDDFKTYCFAEEEVFKNNDAEMQEFIKFMFSYDTYKDMPPIEGAVEGLRHLGEKNDVFLATNCITFTRPNNPLLFREYADKLGWVQNNLPFFPLKNVIAISKKHLLHGDCLTDDGLNNLTGDFDKKILYTAWHNKGIADETLKNAGAVRADNWSQIIDIIENS